MNKDNDFQEMKTNLSDNVCDFNDIKKPSFLTTFYYRTMPYIYSDNNVIGPRYNYSNYDIWCLNKNVSNLFSNNDLTFIIKAVPIKDKMVLSVFPQKNGKKIELSIENTSNLQEEINYICTQLYKKCLLYDPTKNNTFGNDWTMNIFPYLTIDTKYNPTFINGKLYLELNENTDYDIQFENCSNDLIEQMAELYLKGAINCDNEFAEKWDLIKYNNFLYIPKWNDNRITNDRANFLITLLQNKNVLIKTIPDMLLKHYLSNIYTEEILFEINSGNILIKPSNIKQIYKILDFIDTYIQQNKIYTIFILPINDVKLIEKYCGLIAKQYKDVHCTSYKISDNKSAGGKYMFSAVANVHRPEMEDTLSKLLLGK